jgi:hypothetical protein
MSLRALSLGSEVDVRRPRTGAVLCVFKRAVNLTVGSEMWTVLDSTRPDCPFGVRLAPADVEFTVKAQDHVCIRAGYLAIGRLVLDCRTALRWEPTPWTLPASGLAIRLDALERAARHLAWNGSAVRAADLIAALRGSDAQLASAVRRTVGGGPGLTPAGDDVIIGILALLTSGAAGTAGGWLASRIAQCLAPILPTTSDVSRHLLGQAIRGLRGRGLDDLGHLLMEGGPPDVFQDAIQVVLRTGCTSGADACIGLVAACRFVFPGIERAAA